MAWTVLRHGLRPHQYGRLRQRNLVRIDLQAILCGISSASLFIACEAHCRDLPDLAERSPAPAHGTSHTKRARCHP